MSARARRFFVGNEDTAMAGGQVVIVAVDGPAPHNPGAVGGYPVPTAVVARDKERPNIVELADVERVMRVIEVGHVGVAVGVHAAKAVVVENLSAPVVPPDFAGEINLGLVYRRVVLIIRHVWLVGVGGGL